MGFGVAYQAAYVWKYSCVRACKYVGGMALTLDTPAASDEGASAAFKHAPAQRYSRYSAHVCVSFCNLLLILSMLQVTAAISNSFGFGGHNSAVVFAPFKP